VYIRWCKDLLLSVLIGFREEINQLFKEMLFLEVFLEFRVTIKQFLEDFETVDVVEERAH
jgi:hypothetical protein